MKLTLTTLAATLMATGAIAQTTVQSCNREVTFDGSVTLNNQNANLTKIYFYKLLI